MKFRFLIWDFDGTLFDTYPPLNRSIRQALVDFGGEATEAEVAALLSNTLAHALETLAAQCDQGVETFKEQVYHYWGQVGVEEYLPFPGALDICQRMIAAGGRNYLYTHRERETTLLMLNHHDALDLFADITTGDAGYPRKPDPTGFLAVIERHNLPKAATLGVGDRDLDIQAAHGAGIAGCLFNAQPGDGVTPEYVIGSLDELGEIVGI
ncbi:MAG: HAD-IA family hydrolase [Anaerolineae bacterium]|nr:HAD-IA family hydrolase [Anaerolineae bacterium]